MNLVLEILNIIHNNGYDAYLVGGYPRDTYLGNSSDDYDICTSATSDKLISIFGDKIKVIGYGSMFLTYQDITCQITSYRIDGLYLDKRHPNSIIQATTLYDDLMRRDFIINTLCIDYNGNYIDYLGARQDLDNKIIRCVGNPKRIVEDSIRILRAIRLATVLNFTIESNLLDIIKQNNYVVKSLSFYRKKQELEKIFLSQNSKYGIKLLLECNLMDSLDLINLNELVVVNDINAIWAQLSVIDKYPFSREEKKQILVIQDLLTKDLLDVDNLYYYGLDKVLICAEIKKINSKKIIKLYNNLIIKNRNDIKISILDMKLLMPKLSYKQINKLYKQLELDIIHNRVKNNRESIIKYLGQINIE